MLMTAAYLMMNLTSAAAMVSTARADCVHGSVVSIVAHADDDLYFINPAIINAIKAGKCVQTVVTTAGYFQEPDNRRREAGLQTAYAQMAGVGSVWQNQWVSIAGKPVHRYVLQSDQRISLSFMDLPCSMHDKLDAGKWTSLQTLYSTGQLTRMSWDKKNISYSKADWEHVYTNILRQAKATEVYTLDPDSPYPVQHDKPQGSGSHPDHVHVAKMAIRAVRAYGHPVELKLFDDYPVQDKPINLSASEGTAKHAAMAAYCSADVRACNTQVIPNLQCDATNEIFWGEAWLCRSYAHDLKLP